MPSIIRGFYIPVSANLQDENGELQVLMKLHRCLPLINREDKGDSDAPGELEVVTDQIEAAQALVVSQQVSETWIMSYMDQYKNHRRVVMMRSQVPSTRTGIFGKWL